MNFKRTRNLLTILIVCLVTGISAQTASIDINTSHQKISGFGGINFPRWINDLSADQAETAFGQKDGQLGLSILRISCAPDKNHWSKEVPTAKRAVSYGAKVFASPWSPPASMKSNNNTTGGHLKTSSYNAYADHLNSFGEFMKKNGVSLLAISIQNEPDIKVSYESCDWTSSQMIDFLKKSASRITSTKLMGPESFNFNQKFSDAILKDATAAKKLDIICGHIYGNGLRKNPLAEKMGKEIWMTEHYTTSDRSANLWPDALLVGKELHDCMLANWNAYIWWYIRRSYGLLTDDGKVSKRGYVFSHYSKFIRPGFVRIKATESPASKISVSAYKKGSDIVIVIINQNSSSKNLKVSFSNGYSKTFDKYITSSSKNVVKSGNVKTSNGSLSTTLDGQSITTLVGNGTTSVLQQAATKVNTRTNYPRAFKGVLTINNDIPFNYTIHNVAGMNVESGSGNKTVEAARLLQPGAYIIKIEDTHSKTFFRVIKSN